MYRLHYRFALFACVCLAALATSAPAAVIRVKWDSPANGPGDDWASAYQTVTAAIAASAEGDEIWVAGDASHPYAENITLKDGVGLYGGFAGGEATRDERQWWVNETILDGGEAGSVVTVARGVSAATVLSGFTIRNGKAASGGGIYCYGASPAILNNRITGNTATTVGAGITIASSSGVVASCLIVSNSGAQVGSGIYCTAGAPRLVNNTVVGNSSVSQGAIVLSGTSAVLANSIIAFNSSGVVKGGGTPSLKNNCVFGNTAYDYAGFVTDPTGTDGNISEDPAFADATAGDYRLAVESPCVQAGDSAQDGADWRDLGGQPRVDSWLVDMGAYELVIEHGIIRVKWDSPYDGPGNDWDHAYHTVTAAIATSVAGDEIWVAGDAEHPYVENITLKGGEGLYGGFAGGETTRDQRDWTTNVTILDGGGSETVVRHAYAVTAATVLDGFTIRNGDDGIHSSSYSSTITNNTISANERYGIYCTLYYPSITNNTISGNGDGIYCDRFSSPSITNNTISANSRIGIICDSSSPTITNNTISGNSDNGIYCSESSSPTITNNIVAFNATGIYNSSGTPVLGSNCVFNPDGTNYSGLAAGASDITADPKLMSAAYGKLHIQPGSPCVDAGLDSVVGDGWKDMDGQARIQGAHVDIGADESDGTVWPDHVPVIVRVSPGGDDANDGGSWSRAKRTVQAGIDAASAAGGEVWVAAGTYTEHVTLLSYARVYGGFSGTESALGERHWGPNVVVLDGGGTGDVVTARGSFGVSGLDGFTVRNGGNYGISCSYASPALSNNTISGNGETGIYCDRSSSPSIANNTISGNGQYGIYCYASSPTITNNTISGNETGIYCRSSSSPTITNNIVAFNATGIYSSSGTPVLGSNCVFNPDQTNYSGLAAGMGDISADPKFQSAAHGRLHIQPDSPCVDAGLDSAVATVPRDIDGQARIQGAHVDIGADESDGTVWPEFDPVIVRVSPDGVDDAAHDGSSWDLAKRTVQAGIVAASAAGGEIWVAAGVYSKGITLRAYVYLYGGFAGGESSRDERDWGVNSTVLDGGGSDVVTAAGGPRQSTIDGFTIRNGQYGIYCYASSSPSITNNTISGNSYGIYCSWYSSPSITNNNVAFNATGIRKYSTPGAPELRSNCVFNPDGTDYDGLTAGTGDISEDPLFADRAAGNLRLLPGSPCIDAGDDAGVPPWLIVDKDGNPRISGAHVDIGAYEFQHPATSIPNARGGKDGAPVSLTGVIVTAAWPDVLYVEQPDRACGIRIEKAGHGLTVGQSATVTGVMATTADGERMITASSASGSAGQALPALGMTSRSLGGDASAGYSAAGGTGQQGVTGGTGLNNIGLLVRVAGKVTFIDPGGQFFTIWDGSAVKDADGHDGVRVSAPGLTLPGSGDFVTVTGISSCTKVGENLFPQVLVRTASDIVRVL